MDTDYIQSFNVGDRVLMTEETEYRGETGIIVGIDRENDIDGNPTGAYVYEVHLDDERPSMTHCYYASRYQLITKRKNVLVDGDTSVMDWLENPALG